MNQLPTMKDVQQDLNSPIIIERIDNGAQVRWETFELPAPQEKPGAVERK